MQCLVTARPSEIGQVHQEEGEEEEVRTTRRRGEEVEEVRSH